MSDARRLEALEALPTVRPVDIAWLEVARPMLALPPDAAVVDAADLSHEAVERWVGFFAAAHLLEVSWGARRGAVRTASYPLSQTQHLAVIGAFGRMALVVYEPEGKTGLTTLRRRVQEAVSRCAPYSLDWAAAAYVAAQQEDAW